MGALLVHALTLLTLCRYHLRGVQPASVVPHHLHLLRAWASKNAPSSKVYGQSSCEKGKTEHWPFYPRAYRTNPGSITTASGPLLRPERLSSSQDSLPHSCSFPIATLSACFGGRGCVLSPQFCLVRLLFIRQDKNGLLPTGPPGGVTDANSGNGWPLSCTWPRFLVRREEIRRPKQGSLGWMERAGG